MFNNIEKESTLEIERRFPTGVVRTLDFCISECENMARQLVAI